MLQARVEHRPAVAGSAIAAECQTTTSIAASARASWQSSHSCTQYAPCVCVDELPHCVPARSAGKCRRGSGLQCTRTKACVTTRVVTHHTAARASNSIALHHHLKCELDLEFSIITSNDGMIVTILMIGRTSGMSSIITAYLNSALGCCAGLRHGCVTSGAVYARVRSATVVGALCTALVSIAGAVMQPG